MQFRFIWVGKTRNRHLAALVDDYLARLRRFARCEITEVRESVVAAADAGSADESKRIITALKNGATPVLLEVEGREWSSRELAWQVEKWQNESLKEVVFIIGGAFGVSNELRGQIATQWSLSRLTLTHEMARVVMLEQLYRAYTIVHGLPYQK
jgi:23S rRNA (pseudouridine1915-N3)-methyltransferase